MYHESKKFLPCLDLGIWQGMRDFVVENPKNRHPNKKIQIKTIVKSINEILGGIV